MNHMPLFSLSENDATTVRGFLERNDVGLADILDRASGLVGLDLLNDLLVVLAKSEPNRLEVVQLLRAIEALLVAARCQDGELEASLRWHGTRIHDLGALLSR
ncbi:hypothetical protein AQS8620_02244 [Aquimixticola soesokkakensis]|uniref:Uncharacterized protein n=1 Tax=Aquimixticola soesokkakensis TaxID=1519096 RepID=A0A1Y5T3Y5_9RHOB|nr:hypothetical protein [Aquimixticola soesokkakensis]SLN51840.1 hypothetical protein AQS8620_02244 [Aquimixticola soesokkakensis]